MERHKFELLEDFQPSKGVDNRMEMQEFSTAGPGKTGGWMQQKYSTETHPVNLMVSSNSQAPPSQFTNDLAKLHASNWYIENWKEPGDKAINKL